MDAKIKKQINARAKMIQSFKSNVETKRALFALYEAGLISWEELREKIINAKPRFYDVEAA